MLCECFSCMSVYKDQKKKYFIIVGILLEIFRISVACGLTIFVPQTCLNDHSMCFFFFKRIYIQRTAFNVFVMSFNISTFILFCLLFLIEIKRDEWIRKHFDFDAKESNTFINSFRNEHLTLFRKLHTYNRLYYRGYQIISIVYFINVVSSCFILYRYYYDFTTVTVLATNVFLCCSKLYNGLIVSKTSLDNNIPKCYSSKMYVTFNVIDDTHKIKNIDGPFYPLTKFLSDTSCKSHYVLKEISNIT
jgi:hypothetical protein